MIYYISLIILVICFGILGGWLSRMCGGAPPKLKYGLDQWIYSIPYLFIGYSNYIFMIISYGFAVLGKRTGHGGGMDLGLSNEEPNKGRSLEQVEILIYPWLFDKISRYWYDVTVLLLTSVLSNIGAVISLLLIGYPILAVVFLFIGSIIKPLSYMFGWKFAVIITKLRIPHLDCSTAVGEFLNGLFHYILISITFIIIFLI